MKRVLLFTILLWICTFFVSQGQTPEIYINEIVADNSQGILDEFGETSDWFEIYNYGSSAIDLEGFSVTDDPLIPNKWIFPHLILSSGNHLLIFASDRDIFNIPVTWSTVIDQDVNWKYTIPDATTSSSWNSLGFDDSAWNTGKSGFGYGDGDDATVVPAGTISIYLRQEFVIDDLSKIERGLLHADYDDGFVAYLNGMEIGRANIGLPGSEVTYNQTADNANHEAQMHGGGKPELFIIDAFKDLLKEGNNVLAVEVHNANSGSSDLTIIPFLTIGYNNFNGVPNHLPLLDLPGSSIHTNFKLSRSGEYLGLYDSTGLVVDSLTFGIQKTDISYGRSSIDPVIWGYFYEPTPGTANGVASFAFSESASFSHSGGFYSGAQNISLVANNPSEQIYYTTDGTIPDESSNLYSAPIILDTTTAIRARVFGGGSIPSDVITQTYFIDEEINLPFISLVTDPDNLFSDDRGIYVTGTNGKRGSCDATIRNVNQDWERAVNIELYNMNGEAELNQTAGIKIFGGCSRHRYPQKSFSLFARREYGKGSFQAQLFPDKDIHEFEAFILRSSADDQRFTMIKDAFAQYSQIEYMDIDYQAYRPAVVFINGEYWGIHNMREKINEHYLTGNYNTDTDDVNILQSNAGVSHGSNASYWEMMNFAQNSNLNTESNYLSMKSKMDINQYIDYQIANIYLAEVDWPGNNIKFWNTNSQYYNRWRWITFDRDQTYLTHRIETNTLDLSTATDAPGWPNPPWSTLLFRRLLTNDEFRDQFIQIYAYHLNTTFEKKRIDDLVDSFKARIQDEIPRHIGKWGGKVDPDMNESWKAGPTFNSVAEWEGKLREIKAFASDRPHFAITHLKNKFNLSGMVKLNVNAEKPEAGTIKMYNKRLPADGYSGDHFTDANILLKAISNVGYNFSHWSISAEDTSYVSDVVSLNLVMKTNTNVSVHFDQNAGGAYSSVIINEINYNSPDDRNTGDWVELYNNSKEIIDLEGWTLKDGDDEHVFVFPHDQELQPYSYLVVCENVKDFQVIHLDVKNRIGDLQYKFSNGGEVIRLYNINNVLIDSVSYADNDPWPEKADGSGPTLELMHPDDNNDIPGNWMAFYDFGTPGRVNSTITDLDEFSEIHNPNVYLAQNYPNPAIGFTNIEYMLSKDANVKLKLFDVLGKSTTNLVNKHLKTGNYQLQLTTSDLPNGIYLYVLHINGKPIASKRMVVKH